MSKRTKLSYLENMVTFNSLITIYTIRGSANSCAVFIQKYHHLS